MPPQDVLGGELQTLISTLQNTNTQLGLIIQALGKINATLIANPGVVAALMGPPLTPPGPAVSQ